jgi:ATP-dependent helicase/nuclease subunit B
LLGGGVQMQLFAYLRALQRVPEFRKLLGVDVITAAGAFYLNLRGGYKTAASRDEALESVEEARGRAYQHRGRFAVELLNCFDTDCAAREAGDQFSYKRKKDGGIDGRFDDPIPAESLETILAGIERQLVAMGRAIFSGDISINPYRHGSKTPCEHCEFDAICRIDRTSHEFRALNSPEANP